MTNLGVGIIGCGNISAAYLRLTPLFRGIEIRAVADAHPGVEQFGAQQKFIGAGTDIQSLDRQHVLSFDELADEFGQIEA